MNEWMEDIKKGINETQILIIFLFLFTTLKFIDRGNDV